MRTIGMKPGDAVLLIERRGEQEVVYHALAVNVSMDERLAGTMGEMSIDAAFVAEDRCLHHRAGVVHFSHRDWVEGRARLAYEEIPYPHRGVCRYCGCTERRACVGGCGWADLYRTVCSSAACLEKALADGARVEVNRALCS
jgi:hypothetical protein